MKRSRYSATMSRCFGSSNQSRERNRRWGLSDAMRNDSLWQAGHVDLHAEQAAREGLLLALLGVERNVRRGDVERPQIVTRERRLGHGGAWQAHRRQQFALGRIAAESPAAEHARPDAAFDVDDRSVGKSFAGAEARENPLVGERAVTRAIERVDDPGKRIGVVEHAAVGTFRGAVAHDIARVAALATGI